MIIKKYFQYFNPLFRLRCPVSTSLIRSLMTDRGTALRIRSIIHRMRSCSIPPILGDEKVHFYFISKYAHILRAISYMIKKYGGSTKECLRHICIKGDFMDRLKNKEFVILDGAMGTMIYEKGVFINQHPARPQSFLGFLNPFFQKRV